MAAAEGLLVSGNLYMDRLTGAGASTGMVEVGNATKLEVKANSELKELISRRKDNYGTALASVSLPTKSDIAFTLDMMNKENLAAVWMGTATELDITGAAVGTPVAITAKLDKWVTLDTTNNYFDLTAVVVQDVTDTTTYVLDTDYSVDADNGMIMALSTGAITADEVLHVAFTYGSLTGYQVTGGTDADVKVGLYLDGVNMVNQKRIKLWIYQVQVIPNAGLDFMSPEFLIADFTGTSIAPTGKTEAYKVVQLD